MAKDLATQSALAWTALQEANKKKGFPAFLFQDEPDKCVWLCTCGAPYFYSRKDGKHGGPIWRIEGHPEWSPGEGSCWRSKAYKVKCTTPKGIHVLTHEGYDPPTEADIARFTASARSQRRRYKEAVYEIDNEKALIFWCP